MCLFRYIVQILWYTIDYGVIFNAMNFFVFSFCVFYSIPFNMNWVGIICTFMFALGYLGIVDSGMSGKGQ